MIDNRLSVYDIICFGDKFDDNGDCKSRCLDVKRAVAKN